MRGTQKIWAWLLFVELRMKTSCSPRWSVYLFIYSSVWIFEPLYWNYRKKGLWIWIIFKYDFHCMTFSLWYIEFTLLHRLFFLIMKPRKFSSLTRQKVSRVILCQLMPNTKNLPYTFSVRKNLLCNPKTNIITFFVSLQLHCNMSYKVTFCYHPLWWGPTCFAKF